jgi:hypothetical protein
LFIQDSFSKLKKNPEKAAAADQYWPFWLVCCSGLLEPPPEDFGAS